MPQGEIVIDPPEIFKETQSVAQSAAQSVAADSATTNIKAEVAKNPDDQKYVYKKVDNAIVLILKMELPVAFRHEK